MGVEPSERRRAAKARAELARQAERAEAARAQVLIDEFVAAAKAQGLEARPLKARTFDGRIVRTDKVGWYLRNNHTVAVDVDGNYYSLTVSAGFLDRFRGVALTPTLPPLVVGRGGRDGETGDLREFLAWTLDGSITQDD